MAAAVIGAAVTGGVFLRAILPSLETVVPTTAGPSPSVTSGTVPTGTAGTLGGFEETVIRVAESAGPSIVGIYVEIPSGILYTETGSGSGIVMSDDGYILTNNHVVCDTQGSYVNGTVLTVYRTDGGEPYAARMVGRDAQTDLAVLKIEADGLSPAVFGDSDQVRVGQATIAIGNPAGLDFMGSVTSGVVSGLDREVVLESGVVMRLIQTDAAINPGNSGGALLDSSGRIIGINNAGLAKDEYEGVNFAIPSNLAFDVFEGIKANSGSPGRPYMGVTVLSDEEYKQIQESYGLPEAGVYIATVARGGPAEAAGLAEGDVITAWNGRPISGLSDLTEAIGAQQPGDEVVLTLVRPEDGEAEIHVVLGERFD